MGRFEVQNRQIHDPGPIISRGLAKLYCIQHNVAYANIDPPLKLSKEVVISGLITWNIHLHVVSNRHSVAKQGNVPLVNANTWSVQRVMHDVPMILLFDISHFNYTRDKGPCERYPLLVVELWYSRTPEMHNMCCVT